MNKIKSVQEKKFEDLPARVIIHEILSRYEFQVKIIEPSTPEFSLYGYFKNDQSRHIWFVFSSVAIRNLYSLRGKLISWLGYLEINRLVSFEILYPSRNQLKILTEESQQMRMIETLSFTFDESHDGYLSLFSKDGCFPNLMSLSFGTDERKFVREDWYINEKDNIFERLKSFKVDGDIASENTINKIFKRLGGNLVTAIFSVEFPREVTLDLPNLQNLTLSGCENLYISSINIKKLYYYGCDENCLKSIYQENQDMVDMNISIYGRRIFGPWVLNRNINPLNKIRKLGLSLQFENCENSTFGENIETLILNGFRMKEDSSIDQEYPKLTTLDLCNITEDKPTKSWMVLKHVKDLTIQRLQISDELFQLNEFEKLETLFIQHFCSFTKFGRILKNLRSLTITQCHQVSDTAFRNEFLPGLGKLAITNCDLITGQQWNQKNLNNLEELEVIKCDKFTDQFFQENQLLKLKRLEFEEDRRITGKKWKALPQLEELRIYDLEFLNNELFESGNLDNLHTLNIFKFRGNIRRCTRGSSGSSIEESSEPSLLGSGRKWKVPNLKVLDGDSELFDPKFLENPNHEYLQEECEVVMKKKKEDLGFSSMSIPIMGNAPFHF